MDPNATGPNGAHALVALLRDHGVEVVVADTVPDAERLARRGSLLLVADTAHIAGDDLLQRLADLPGDRLLLQPTSRARHALAPQIHGGHPFAFSRQPDCELREATRAGRVDLRDTATYAATDTAVPALFYSCYDGALVRYRSDGTTITVVGTDSFMTNSGLLRDGNAALAMNLAGARPRLVWYAPQHLEGETAESATLFGLVPKNVKWLFWQLCLVVALAALWRGRRLGPLVAERLPVVVRASETVEGRGRLYRSRRARDRAAQALRTATLQRLSPRLGLSSTASVPSVVDAVARRSNSAPEPLNYLLFGPPPASDTDLLHLANSLDDIERKVTGS